MEAAAASALIGSDTNPANATHEHGARVLHSLYVALSCLQDSAVEGGDRREAVERFVAAIAIRDLGELVLSASGHAITMNGVRVGLESRSFVAVESILATFAKRSIGGFVIGRHATNVEVDLLLRTVANGGELSVAAELIRRGIRHLSVLPVDDGALTLLLDLAERHSGESSPVNESTLDDATSNAREVTSDLRSVYVATLLLEHIGEVRVGGPRLAKSIIKCLADALLAHPELIDLLAVLQESDAEFVRHGAMVAVYSVLIGRRIGLPTQLLIELGVAALFHDVGRLDARDDLGEDEHVLRGFERFLALEPCALSLRAMLVARRHHDSVDDAALSEPGLEQADLFSAIVHTADIYDHAVGDENARPGTRDGLAAVEQAADQGIVPKLLAQALTAVARQAP